MTSNSGKIRTNRVNHFDWEGLIDNIISMSGKFIDTWGDVETSKNNAAAAAAMAATKTEEEEDNTMYWIIGGGVALVVVVLLVVLIARK